MRFASLLLSGLAATSLLSAQSQQSLYVVPDPTPGQWLLMQQQFDVLGNCCGSSLPRSSVEVIVDQNQVALLMSIAPAARFVRHGQPYWMTALQNATASGLDVPPPEYYTNAEIEAEIDAQVAAYPGLAQKVDLSTLPGGVVTHEGRHIIALKVSDNVAADEDEPAIVLAAQHHARELNSPVMVLGAMQRILAGYASDPQLQAIVDNYEVYFLPTVNPDGVNHVWTVSDFWRKNRRVNGGGAFGVDNNRNYPFLWGQCGASTNPSSDTYRGPSAGSEPETQVMRNLIALLRPEIYLDYHSSGREVLRTYAPCANVNPTIFAFQEHYVDDLRGPMGYGKRDPSASGESPEDHWASGGTLSFLTEIGTSFQPAYASTAAEEIMVWPGIRQALTTWRPALRGHVRSALGAAPLAATITYTPNVFNHGEVAKSRSRDGRYGLWLPLGSWNVTFAAPGHQSRTVPVTVSSYDSPVALDVLLETSAAGTPTIVKNGTGSLGTVVTFTYTSPGDAGRMGFCGWALDTAPGINLGDQRVIPLNNDPFFQAAWVGNPFLSPTWDTLNGADQMQSVLIVPNQAWLVGLTTWFGGLTFDSAWQSGVKTWSQPVSVTVIP
jgi:hypothetical protein